MPPGRQTLDCCWWPPLLQVVHQGVHPGRLSLWMPSPSRCGDYCLIPKIGGVPTAAQFWPITLLCTDYKLFTKMLTAGFLVVLPSVLHSSQLCSVRGQSIFEGSAAILSAAEYFHQRWLPGFLSTLDFFHAYDHVCLQWVDQVLKAVGYGPLLRRIVTMLHKGGNSLLSSPILLTSFGHWLLHPAVRPSLLPVLHHPHWALSGCLGMPCMALLGWSSRDLLQLYTYIKTFSLF